MPASRTVTDRFAIRTVSVSPLATATTFPTWPSATTAVVKVKQIPATSAGRQVDVQNTRLAVDLNDRFRYHA